MNLYIDGVIYTAQKTGGISRYFNELLPRLYKMGVNVELATHNRILGELPILPKDHIKSIGNIRIPPPRRFFGSFLNPINKYLENNYWSKKTNGVFHTTYFSTFPTLKIPQVVTVYDMIYEKFPDFFYRESDHEFIKIKKKSFDAASAIIAISESTKKDLMEAYNISESKIYVTHLGVNDTFVKIQDANLKKDFLVKKNISKPFLLFLGSRIGYKNFQPFLQSFVRLNNPNLDVVTLGGGSFTAEENQLLEKLGIKNKVHNFGFVSDQDLIMWYNTAAAFVFPSLYEGFGIPLLEALACGTPLVCSNTSSFYEVAGEFAEYFDPSSVPDMAEKISKSLHGNNRQSGGMARAKEFSWDKTVQETLSIYKLL